MSKPVEQALVSLVPSLNTPLPSELIDLAVSLLAQSRSKASSLKPDEEIARTYACSHLACERLKQRLNLPQIIPRPPVPPRIYKKVYNYFDTVLAARIPQTPRKRGHDIESATSTPGKRTPAVTPSTVIPRQRATPGKQREATNNDEAPEWAMPVIRQLCRALNAPAAPPHVYAGVCSVLKLQNATSPSRTRTRRTSASSAPTEPVSEPQIPALIVVLLFYTIIRLSGRTTTGNEHQRRRSKAVAVLREHDVCKDQSDDEVVELIERYLGLAQKGWLDLEWFHNIAEGSGLDKSNGTNGHQDETEDIDSEGIRPNRSATTTPKRRRITTKSLTSKPALMQGGLGTMFQDKVDYLSEERRLSFLEWKDKIMARIEQIEEQQRTNGTAIHVPAG